MIIESLIQDASKLTFDCAKATLEKGSKIQIDDIHWKALEVQNAIAAGLCILVGPPPILPEERKLEPEHKVRFRNQYITKLCFECVKDYADPGMIVHIPVSKLEEPEIRNAISAGWLTNEDNPELTPPRSRTAPVQLMELDSSDILDTESSAAFQAGKPAKEQPLPEGVPTKRPSQKKVANSQIKAKKIGSAHEEDDGGDLYKESQVIMPKQPSGSKKQAPKAAPLIVDDEPQPGEEPEPAEDTIADDDFDFTNVFTKNQPKKKK